MNILDKISDDPDSPVFELIHSRKFWIISSLVAMTAIAGIILLILSSNGPVEDAYKPTPHPNFPKLITIGNKIPGSYTVALIENVPLDETIRELNLTYKGVLKSVNRDAHQYAVTLSEYEAQELSKDPRVENIFEDQIIETKNKKQ